MRNGRPLPRSPHPAPKQQQVLGEDHFPREVNALEQLLARLTPLEQRTYPMSREARGVVIVTITLAVLTTWVFSDPT